MANEKMIELLNKIRQEATQDYQDRIPEATRDNIEQIRYAMLGDDNVTVANEFTSTIVNKLVKSIVHTKLFTNPLKSLKKGKKDLGDNIEEIYTNFLKGEAPNREGSTLLKRKYPDVKTIYHRMNYKHQYTVSVSREELTRAFSSYDDLERYINNIINTLYNSAELDEFMNMKQIIKSALTKGAMVVQPIADPLESDASGKEFIKAVKTISGLMVFPSANYNSYLAVQSKDKEPIKTFSRKNEQILILDTATDVSVSVDVLASLFNMSVAEFNDTRKIVIDSFPEVDGGVIHACLVDEQFFQIYDDFFGVTAFTNPQGLYTNYYLHVYQTLAYSVLVNAVAFKTETTETTE